MDDKMKEVVLLKRIKDLESKVTILEKIGSDLLYQVKRINGELERVRKTQKSDYQKIATAVNNLGSSINRK